MAYQNNQQRGNYGNRGNSGGYGGNRPFTTPYVPTALDDYKLRLSTSPVNGSKGRPALSVTFTGANPRINVYTEVDGDKNNGKIQAKMDLYDFYEILEVLDQVASTNDEVRWVKELKQPSKPEQNEDGTFGKKGPPEIVATVLVGRDNSGRVFISVLSPDGDRPKIQFFFGDHYYSKLVRKSAPSEFIPDREVSTIAARAWVTLYRQLLAVQFITGFKKPEKKEGGNDSFKKQSQPSKSYGSDGSANSLDESSSVSSGGGGAFEDDDFPF